MQHLPSGCLTRSFDTLICCHGTIKTFLALLHLFGHMSFKEKFFALALSACSCTEDAGTLLSLPSLECHPSRMASLMLHWSLAVLKSEAALKLKNQKETGTAQHSRHVQLVSGSSRNARGPPYASGLLGSFSPANRSPPLPRFTPLFVTVPSAGRSDREPGLA